MASPTYALFHEAILTQRQIHCRYRGKWRETCPIVLGYKDREEKALVFQFGGESNTKLPPSGEWRCLKLADVREAELRDGAWREGDRHSQPQSCIDIVDLDINIQVRKRR